MPKKSIKLLIVLLAAAIAVIVGLFLWPDATVSAQQAQAPFSDVLESHAYRYPIEQLRIKGFVSGYSDGTFQPDKKVSRAEALAIAIKASGTKADKLPGKLSFTDVSKDDWFYNQVRTGVALNKLGGYPDNTFRPHAAVNRMEALAIALSFFQQHTLRVAVQGPIYHGLDSSAWYAKRAQFAKDMNILEPDTNGYINASEELTRGQLADIIYRTLTVRETKKPFDITIGWTTTNNRDNYWQVRHPKSWQIFLGTKNSVIWKGSPRQVFFTRIFPKGANLSLSLIENPDKKTAEAYFADLRKDYAEQYGAASVAFKTSSLAGHPALRIESGAFRIMDAVIQIPDGRFLVLYGKYGEDLAGDYLKKQMEAVIESYEYLEPEKKQPPPLEERLATAREFILVEGKGQDVLSLFSDRKLIETDAIGIGTGPVDYYYSAEANHTFKFERSTNTVLNLREGSTTKF